MRPTLTCSSELGIAHYRLSIAWPRVFPSGDGPINTGGLDHYSRLIDALLARGITPWVTLFHWDLPQALEDRGGWLVRGTVDAFDRYAQAVVKRLGDRVTNWFTVNEIPCFIGNGYGNGYSRRANEWAARAESGLSSCAYSHTAMASKPCGRSLCPGREWDLVHNHLPAPPIPVIETAADIAAARSRVRANERTTDGARFPGPLS